ncbi:MAG: MMPL family transporter [Myxococcales bacterium]|nr:MMPL family transporter [Myxococcales bacterium]
MNSIEQTIGRWLAQWVGGVQKSAVSITIGMSLATLVIIYYVVSHLGIHGDTESLFSQDLPFKQVERRYHEAFPMLYENMFVVIDAPTPERAGEAAASLAARLEAEPRRFHRAYLPGGGEFFENHAFLYLETEELEDLADKLAIAQPYLAELSRDGTLRGLASMMARGGRAVREGDVSGDQLHALFDRFLEALSARIEGRPYHLSWAEVLADGDFDLDARRRFLLVQPVLEFDEFQPAKRSILAVRRIANELGFTPESGVIVRITGDVALSFEEMEVLRTQAVAAGIASLVLVAIILILGLRSIRMVLSTLATLIVGLVWTAGFTAAAIGHLNLISVCFAVLFIGLGVDFGIHVCIRYRELLASGLEHSVALNETARDVGSSIFLCATTTAIGFFAFVPTDFIGVAELGLISGTGMFISLFCTLTLLPALLSLRPIPAGREYAAGVSWSNASFTNLPLRHPRAIRGTALVMGIGAVLLLPQARFDNNPLNVRDPSSESVRTFNELLEKGASSPWSLNAVAPSLESAQFLAERLKALDVVERVVTVSDYVPADQENKLGIIEDVAMFVAPPPGPDGKVPPPSLAEQEEALVDLSRELGRLQEFGEQSELVASASRLRPVLGRYLQRLTDSPDPTRELEALQSSMLGTLPEQLRMLNAALSAGHVTLEKLPDTILERMITADGRVRIQIFPRDDLNDHAALAAFVDGVKTVTPEVAGSASEILESGRSVVRALTQAMLSAFIVITLFLLILWRRIDDTALVLIPLLLASALTVAAAVLLDIPFNFADVIVLPLLLGIGVDSGIHLVHRVRVAAEDEVNLLATSTARAVAYSALTTIASFGSLGLATHLGLATLGRLLTIGVCFTVVCNLIVLPALIRPRSRRPELVDSNRTA